MNFLDEKFSLDEFFVRKALFQCEKLFVDDFAIKNLL